MSYGRKPIPPFPGWGAALGPGIVWMALAQGSGELIWWPYLVAKYGLTFLVLLIPACLLQYPLTVEVGRYTLLTGETIFRGFLRLHRGFGIVLWILMTLSFLWFGAFASAGGTAMAALTHFPSGWSPRGQTLFWGYSSIAIFLVAMSAEPCGLPPDRMVHESGGGHHGHRAALGLPAAGGLADAPALLRRTLWNCRSTLPRPWDPADGTKLLTGITFAGLGGFWILFYSYWLRDKGGERHGGAHRPDYRPDRKGGDDHFRRLLAAKLRRSRRPSGSSGSGISPPTP
ncbi:MAG: Nramp family divalent metal transporter [Candidatus Manganitrophus sp.]|nr:MAG: Nramp family divalent metal transporter [Candidatus Manganitrophus sp.]